MFNKLRELREIETQISSQVKGALTKDKVAQILQSNPQALEAFEQAYSFHALDAEQNNFFGTNSRQAAAQRHAEPNFYSHSLGPLIARIVDELLAQTKLYVYDGKEGNVTMGNVLPADTKLVDNKEITQLPIELQPQLSGTLAKVDIDAPSSSLILYYYKQFLEEKHIKNKQDAYNRFRQGLDILDLDPITYNILFEKTHLVRRGMNR